MSQTLYLTPGTVIGVPASWGGVTVEHVGILTDRIVDGERTVISGSKRRGKVVEEKLTVFLDGQKGRIIGFLGRHSPHVVVARARASLGRRWDLMTQNCEHLVREFHGLVPVSPQLAARAAGVVLGVALIALLFALARR